MSALWQPYWQAAHAYALTAVVIPTTFGGYTWRCTTAGTTGNAEPTWPTDPSLTPTVTDGTVVWSVGTGFRQALQSGIASVVTAFAAANPTIIRSIRTVQPLSFANVELPCFFIGDMSESIAHANGIRQRAFSGFSAYLVDALGSIDESNDRMNFAADVLTDLFTANYHAANGRSIVEHTATNDTEISDRKGEVYPALQFQFGQSEVAEGRN
jgi:hypothetical protein